MEDGGWRVQGGGLRVHASRQVMIISRKIFHLELAQGIGIHGFFKSTFRGIMLFRFSIFKGL